MRILFLSDLHQGEYGRPFSVDEITTDFDVLVAAGDCARRLTNAVAWIGERFAGVPTIYVPGNHDFYRDGGPNGFTVEDELEAGFEVADKFGIHLLADRSVEIDDVVFHGATLWTDMRSNNHWSSSAAMGDAKRRMNDYRAIHRKSSSRGSRRIQPRDTMSWHRQSRDFLTQSVKASQGRTNVVVTHHAPSYRSLADQLDTLNHCYASHLDNLVEMLAPDAWIHGHVHRQIDYDIGRTKVVANPLGYSMETTDFDPNRTIVVGQDPRPTP